MVQANVPTHTPQKKSKKGLIIVGCVELAVIVALVAVLIVNHYNDNSSLKQASIQTEENFSQIDKDSSVVSGQKVNIMDEKSISEESQINKNETSNTDDSQKIKNRIEYIVKNGNDIGQRWLYASTEYDSNGNEVRYLSYNEDGSIDSSTKSEYDINGNRIKWIWYFGEDIIQVYFVTDYDNNGNEIKTTMYGGDGNISLYNEYEYDSEGNKTRCTSYNEDGSIFSWDVYGYDGKGNKTVVTSYDEDGRVTDYYEYDSRGNMTKWIYTYYSEDGSADSSEGKCEYKYDYIGNILKETYYNAEDEMSYYIEHEYDSKGKETKYTRYNADGDIYSCGWYEYVYE
jgi:hypothetical protein